MLERELYTLLNGTADAAFTVDGQGLICSWNRAAEKLFGYPATEILHKSCAGLLQGRGNLGTEVCNEPCDVIECALAHREISNYDLEVSARFGRRIWVNVSILVFHDERTKRHLVVHLCRDISRRKKNEELTQKFLRVAKQLAKTPEGSDHLSPVSPLTDAERKVLQLLSEGQKPAEIVRELRISPRTLRNHIHHVNQKLHTRDRLEAVMHAIRRGLI